MADDRLYLRCKEDQEISPLLGKLWADRFAVWAKDDRFGKWVNDHWWHGDKADGHPFEVLNEEQVPANAVHGYPEPMPASGAPSAEPTPEPQPKPTMEQIQKVLSDARAAGLLEPGNLDATALWMWRWFEGAGF